MTVNAQASVNPTSTACRPSIEVEGTLPLDGFSRWRQIARFIPYSRETARLREIEGLFPKRIRLTQRCSAWSNRELHRFLADPAHYRADDQ